MNYLFEKKSVLVTGSGSGIGRFTALAFAKEGANIIVSDINEASGQETVDLIKKEGREAVFIKCNVADAEEVKKLMEDSISHYGTLDVAVNNAGIGGGWHRMADYPLEEYRKVIAINQDGVFYCMKYQIQQMLKQENGGAIVNISSIAGLKGLANSSPYSASKHAVIGLTKAAAVEYARNNIRINAVCPVFTRTPLFDKMFEINPAYEEKLKLNIPMKRYGQPHEIAEAILWLCCEKAGFITGQALSVDGGMTAQ